MPGLEKTNLQLANDLAKAAKMDRARGRRILGQIIVWDASADGKVSCTLDMSSGDVTGGRLGRDHLPEDVPNHFVRDKLMDYINTKLSANQRDGARRAVFSDLSDDDIAGYSAMIAYQRLELEAKETNRVLWRYRIREGFPLREARSILKQDDALYNIDGDIDLSPRAGCPQGTAATGPFARSVVRPSSDPTPEEEALGVESYPLDRDCDQVRAMLKQLADGGGWTAEGLRVTLGNVTRPEMTKFLTQRGPMAGRRLDVYHLAWGFLKRRELLGVPLTGPVSDSDHNDIGEDALQDDVVSNSENTSPDNNVPQDGKVLQETSSNKRQKSPSTGGGRVLRPRKRARVS